MGKPMRFSFSMCTAWTGPVETGTVLHRNMTIKNRNHENWQNGATVLASSGPWDGEKGEIFATSQAHFIVLQPLLTALTYTKLPDRWHWRQWLLDYADMIIKWSFSGSADVLLFLALFIIYTSGRYANQKPQFWEAWRHKLCKEWSKLALTRLKIGIANIHSALRSLDSCLLTYRYYEKAPVVHKHLSSDQIFVSYLKPNGQHATWAKGVDESHRDKGCEREALIGKVMVPQQWRTHEHVWQTNVGKFNRTEAEGWTNKNAARKLAKHIWFTPLLCLPNNLLQTRSKYKGDAEKSWG